jgi:hypothetical protein
MIKYVRQDVGEPSLRIDVVKCAGLDESINNGRAGAAGVRAVNIEWAKASTQLWQAFVR